MDLREKDSVAQVRYIYIILVQAQSDEYSVKSDIDIDEFYWFKWPNANCTDTIGSYDCTSVVGYNGNGFTLFIVCT